MDGVGVHRSVEMNILPPRRKQLCQLNSNQSTDSLTHSKLKALCLISNSLEYDSSPTLYSQHSHRQPGYNPCHYTRKPTCTATLPHNTTLGNHCLEGKRMSLILYFKRFPCSFLSYFLSAYPKSNMSLRTYGFQEW